MKPTILRGAYYTSVVRFKPDNRFIVDAVRLLAGPFEAEPIARGYVEPCRTIAEEIDVRAHWYGFGTVRVRSFSRRRPGLLNAQLGLPVTIEDPWR